MLLWSLSLLDCVEVAVEITLGMAFRETGSCHTASDYQVGFIIQCNLSCLHWESSLIKGEVLV